MEHINENGKWLIENGVSILVEPTEEWTNIYQPKPTQEEIYNEKMSQIRELRNTKLLESDYIINRHIEQRELLSLNAITETFLTEDQYKLWLEYRQQLRDVPSEIQDIDTFEFPEQPTDGTAFGDLEQI